MKNNPSTQIRIPSYSTLMKAVTSLLMLTSVFTPIHSHYTVNPRGYYYAHHARKDAPRLLGRPHPVSQGSVVMYPRYRPDQEQQLHEPSCGQLRSLWHASVKDMSNKLGFFVFPDDLDQVLSNPYYQNLVKSPGRFGKIVTETRDEIDSNNEPTQEILYGHERKYSDIADDVHDNTGIVDASYGNVVYSPDEKDDGKAGTFGNIVVVEAPSRQDRQRPQEAVYGSVVRERKTQSQQVSESTTRASNDQRSAHLVSTAARKQKTEHQGSDPSSANDFFNSVWPVKHWYGPGKCFWISSATQGENTRAFMLLSENRSTSEISWQNRESCKMLRS